MGPTCIASVTVNGSELNEGDYAGICALQGCYGLIALTKEAGRYFLVMIAKEEASNNNQTKRGDNKHGKVLAKIPVETSTITLRAYFNFVDQVDEVEFYYLEQGKWKMLGIKHKLHFKLDHFMGCRVGLFLMSMKETNGVAEFSRFRHQVKEPSDASKLKSRKMS